jgi:drug/metabolite transporter (DMT)-like permease
MKQKRIQSGSVRRRLLVLAPEIRFGIAVVILILLYAIHEHDPWMPRPAVLTASSWMILGLVGIGVSVRTKQLQRKLLDRYAAKLPALESWLVPLALGVAAVVFGASRLSDIYRRGVLPNDTGRIALFTNRHFNGNSQLVEWPDLRQ